MGIRLGCNARKVGHVCSLSRLPGGSAEGSPLSIESIGAMKNRLPGLRKQLNSDPAYFKKVYMHTFDLAKAPGSRTVALDSGERK